MNIALPKGRLGEKVYRLLADLGYQCPDLLDEGRRLIFVNEEAGVKYFLVKPSDVAIYVEYGAADVGVVGRDILEEGDFDIYELADLGFGVCRMAVAAKRDFRDDLDRPLRVATKFPAIASRYYASQGREIEIIKLNGSIELAPVLGLSDVIVDIVETGSTLRENGLAVFEEILPISARLIANKSACQFKEAEISAMVAAVKERTNAPS